jgi:hypothetical protein
MYKVNESVKRNINILKNLVIEVSNAKQSDLICDVTEDCFTEYYDAMPLNRDIFYFESDGNVDDADADKDDSVANFSYVCAVVDRNSNTFSVSCLIQPIDLNQEWAYKYFVSTINTRIGAKDFNNFRNFLMTCKKSDFDFKPPILQL